MRQAALGAFTPGEVGAIARLTSHADAGTISTGPLAAAVVTVEGLLEELADYRGLIDNPSEGPPPLENVRRELRRSLTRFVDSGILANADAHAARDLVEAYVRLGGDLELEQPAIRAELDAALRSRAELIIAGDRVVERAEKLGSDTFEGRLEDLGSAITGLAGSLGAV